MELRILISIKVKSMTNVSRYKCWSILISVNFRCSDNVPRRREQRVITPVKKETLSRVVSKCATSVDRLINRGKSRQPDGKLLR